MRNALVLISLFFSFGAIANSHDLATTLKSYEGKYELVEALKETKRTLNNRGSLCRDSLEVIYTNSTGCLHLVSRNNSRAGITLNSIVSPKEFDVDIANDDSISQNRYYSKIKLGVKIVTNMITTLRRDDDFLELEYKVYSKSVFRTSVSKEKRCIYQLIK